jgi:four helix bundle protein
MYLLERKVEKSLVIQLLRSGTSMGANVEEAIGGSSRKDFVQKLRIAYREARETPYWLRLLPETDIPEKKMAESVMNDCDENLRMLTAILNTSVKPDRP